MAQVNKHSDWQTANSVKK